MTRIRLTSIQIDVLEESADSHGGIVPGWVKGRTLDSLESKGLIKAVDNHPDMPIRHTYHLTADGYAAIGREVPTAAVRRAALYKATNRRTFDDVAYVSPVAEAPATPADTPSHGRFHARGERDSRNAKRRMQRTSRRRNRR